MTCSQELFCIFKIENTVACLYADENDPIRGGNQ